MSDFSSIIHYHYEQSVFRVPEDRVLFCVRNAIVPHRVLERGPGTKSWPLVFPSADLTLQYVRDTRLHGAVVSPCVPELFERDDIVIRVTLP